ncbi:MAG: hypothetical protein WCK68_07680 [Betaproteobacteria bacterium]|jgi:hypothetical protein
MNFGRLNINQYIGLAIVGIIAAVLFRLLMPVGSLGSFGIWVAAIFFGVLIAGMLVQNPLKKK